MPPFPERESSILAKLKKKKGPGNLPDIDDARRNVNGSAEHSENTEEAKKVTTGTNHTKPLLSCHIHRYELGFTSNDSIMVGQP